MITLWKKKKKEKKERYECRNGHQNGGYVFYVLYFLNPRTKLLVVMCKTILLRVFLAVIFKNVGFKKYRRLTVSKPHSSILLQRL